MSLLAYAGLYALADWAAGRYWPLPGRSVWYVGPLTALASLALPHQLWPAAIGWALWRGALGWSSFGGSMDIQTGREAAGEALRDLASSVFLVGGVLLAGQSIEHAMLITTLFTIAHLALAAVYGEAVRRGRDIGPLVEAARGLAFGLLLGALT